MAFQAHGSFSEFSSSQETCTAYVERLEQYTLQLTKLKIQTNRELYSSVSVVQQFIGLFAAWCHPNCRT